MRWDAEVYDSAKSPQTDAGYELVKAACVKAGDLILDIGCGTGRLTLELAHLAHMGTVTGIEPSVDMINRAREKTASAGNISLLNIPAQSINFKEGFDLIYCNSAFQWIKEQEDVTNRCFRALKPNGRLAVQMPAKDFCWEMMGNIERAISILGLESRFAKMESPWRFLLKDEMAVFLKDAGFSNVKTFYRDYALMFDNVNDVLNWGVSAGLRPFLALLSKDEQERFKYAFAMGFENYRTDKGIEFNFRRLFAFAEKGTAGGVS